MLLLAACDSHTTPDRELCTFVVGPSALDSAPLGVSSYEVTYRAEATGDALIDLLTFEDINGVRTQIEAPVLPWTRTVTLPAGVDASLTVRGAHAEGDRISASLSAQSNETSNGSVLTVTEQSSCGEL